MKQEPLVQMLDIHKTFHMSGVNALKAVNLSLHAGTIHVLLGANGAGKTTLARILCGELQPETGRILLNGKTVNFKKPRDAMHNGIVLVHQDSHLVDDLTVFENIFVGREPSRSIFLSKKKAESMIKKFSEEFALPPLNLKVENLSMSEKQKIEIARALISGARILIFDEPTVYLDEEEQSKLFKIMQTLKRSGCAILLITHDIYQALKIADFLTVLREGEVALSGEVSRFTIQQVLDAMGLSSTRVESKRIPRGGENLLEVLDLSVKVKGKIVLDRLSLSFKEGEIVGLFGLGKDGHFDFLDVIMGLKKPSSGKVIFKGLEITNLSVRERRKLGIAYIPEDRLSEAVNPTASVLENTVVNVYHEKPYSRFGFLNWQSLQRCALSMLQEFDVKFQSLWQPVSTLSGGNLQRLILARELAQKPKLVLACKPTAGLDIQFQSYASEKFREISLNGSVLIATNDIEEVANLCDRVIVFSKGKVKRIVLVSESFVKQDVFASLVGDKR
ncbi:ATP-binding cassette domain-containing protein [Pseudothermotoga sp.]|uniref:ABC transporter ATP-binding protein n=1 Tax=Pseudothermotoga sp. TaxID=2033661 RepID=UPI0031F63726